MSYDPHSVFNYYRRLENADTFLHTGYLQNYGESGFFRACQAGFLPVVVTLAEQFSVDTDVPNKVQRTPLLEACSRGRVSVVRYLLERQFVDRYRTDGNGIGTSELAEKGGHTALATYLQEYDAAAKTAEALLASQQRLAIGKMLAASNGGAGETHNCMSLSPDLLENIADEHGSDRCRGQHKRTIAALAYQMHVKNELFKRFGGFMISTENNTDSDTASSNRHGSV